jgi:CubicO group peptidase (beta-lactamase class C family)
LWIVVILASTPALTAAERWDERAVEDVVREALKAWHVPGVAVAIVRQDAVVYLRGHGLRAVDGKDPVTPDTLFPIASCTKSFTTSALALLADAGKLDWDDSVRKHLPYFRLADPLANDNVVLRDLVCHRTGLRAHDFLWYDAPWPAEETVRRAGRLPLDRPFRSAFQYQSTMFVAAGLAVAAAGGLPWDAFVQKRLLDPLGMTATRLTTSAAEKSADRARPHRLRPGGKVEAIPEYRMEAPDPAGSIYSNARDLAQWLRFHLANGTVDGRRLLAASSLEETHAPQMVIRREGADRDFFPDTRQMSYGMGWVLYDHRGRLLMAHAGTIDGFRAHLTQLPEEKIGIVILANLHQTRFNLALSNSLIDLLLGLPRKDWNAILTAAALKEEEALAEQARLRLERRHQGTRPSRELAAYAGNYDHPAYGTVRVRLERGGLTWAWNRFSAPLEHYHYDTFVLPIEIMGRPLATFGLDAAGTIISLRVEGRLGVEFRRVGR